MKTVLLAIFHLKLVIEKKKNVVFEINSYSRHVCPDTILRKK